MKLERLLLKQKAAVLRNWFNLVVETYPADTSRFLKSQKDPFHNPVGSATKKGLEALFDEIIHGLDPETAASFLDPILRIRAVQDFSPSRATGFILLLKTIIRDILKGSLQEPDILNELLVLERRIDDLCLIGFDIYMKCREKIFQIQANEQRNRVFKAFERAGIVNEMPDDSVDLENSKLTQ